MRSFLSFFLFLSLASPVAQAESLYLGAGVFFQNMMKTTSSATAASSLTGQMYFPEVSVAYRFTLLTLKFMPTIGYTPFAKKEADSIQKNIMTIGIPWIFELTKDLDLKFGPGLLFYSVGGPGGTATLNNGTSTATFYRPAKSRTSKVIYLDVGVGFNFWSSLRLDADFIVPGLFSSRRALNLELKISKGFF